MRLVVCSDVHGNHRALEAVLADAARHAPDAVVNLGDCLSGPLAAATTADLLMAQDVVTVRGNHDRHLLDRPASAMGASDHAADAQITARHRAWLATLPSTLTLSDGDGPDVLLCHGTPTSDAAYLLETVHPDGVALATATAVAERIGGATQRCVFRRCRLCAAFGDGAPSGGTPRLT